MRCRPDLPRLIAAATCGDRLSPLTWAELSILLVQFFDLNLESYDASHAGNPLKQWLVYLRSHYHRAALLFEQIKRLRQPAELRARLVAEMESSRAARSAA